MKWDPNFLTKSMTDLSSPTRICMAAWETSGLRCLPWTPMAVTDPRRLATRTSTKEDSPSEKTDLGSPRYLALVLACQLPVYSL